MLCRFEKKIEKILHESGVVTPCPCEEVLQCVSNLYWGVTSRATWCLHRIWVYNVNGHDKLHHFQKKIEKILHNSGVMPPCQSASCWVPIILDRLRCLLTGAIPLLLNTVCLLCFLLTGAIPLLLNTVCLLCFLLTGAIPLPAEHGLPAVFPIDGRDPTTAEHGLPAVSAIPLCWTRFACCVSYWRTRSHYCWTRFACCVSYWRARSTTAEHGLPAVFPHYIGRAAVPIDGRDPTTAEHGLPAVFPHYIGQAAVPIDGRDPTTAEHGLPAVFPIQTPDIISDTSHYIRHQSLYRAIPLLLNTVCLLCFLLTGAIPLLLNTVCLLCFLLTDAIPLLLNTVCLLCFLLTGAIHYAEHGLPAVFPHYIGRAAVPIDGRDPTTAEHGLPAVFPHYIGQADTGAYWRARSHHCWTRFACCVSYWRARSHYCWTRFACCVSYWRHRRSHYSSHYINTGLQCCHYIRHQSLFRHQSSSDTRSYADGLPAVFHYGRDPTTAEHGLPAVFPIDGRDPTTAEHGLPAVFPIHGRDPTTAEHGDFCLLCFHPGPVRPSLDNLVTLPQCAHIDAQLSADARST